MIAAATLAGMDPLAFARARPGVERDLLVEIAEEAVEQARKLREEQAVFIINKLSEALDRGKKKSGGSSSPKTARGRKR